MALEPGLRGSAELEVTTGDTASALGSGDVDVLATPQLIAVCEAAAVDAVRSSLEAGMTTVGARISLDHLAPTPVGGRVSVVANLLRIEGRTLEFAIEAADAQGVIATGLHVRVVVSRDSFMSAAAERASRSE